MNFAGAAAFVTARIVASEIKNALYDAHLRAAFGEQMFAAVPPPRYSPQSSRVLPNELQRQLNLPVRSLCRSQLAEHGIGLARP
jgi:hypothetical protein